MQYDDVAARYERWVAPQYRAIADVVAERVPPLTDRDVLEVGAGTGLLTGMLARRGGFRSYVATDVSAPMLAMAERLVGEAITYLEADLRAIPLPPASVDLVVSSLSPLQDVVEGFAEALRLLRPGGELVVGFWGDVYAELELLDEVRVAMDLGAYPRDRERAAVALATQAGFAGISLDVVHLPVHHASVDDYLAYRASFGPLGFIPEDRRDEYAATLRRVTQTWAKPDGSVDLDWTIGVLRANTPA